MIANEYSMKMKLMFFKILFMGFLGYFIIIINFFLQSLIKN